MARSIVTASSIATAPKTREAPGGPSGPEPVADGYSDALLKLIPVEVISFYLAGQALLSNSTDTGEPTRIAFFVIGVVITYFYLRVPLKVTNTVQLAISVAAFIVWALALNSTGENAWMNGTHAGLLVLVFTFLAPTIPIDRKFYAKK